MLECDLGLSVSKVKSGEREQTASGEIHDANRGQFCFIVTGTVGISSSSGMHHAVSFYQISVVCFYS